MMRKAKPRISATMPARLSQYVPRCASRSLGSGGGALGAGSAGGGGRGAVSRGEMRDSSRDTVSSSRRTTSARSRASSSAMDSLVNAPARAPYQVGRSGEQQRAAGAGELQRIPGEPLVGHVAIQPRGARHLVAQLEAQRRRAAAQLAVLAQGPDVQLAELRALA